MTWKLCNLEGIQRKPRRVLDNDKITNIKFKPAPLPQVGNGLTIRRQNVYNPASSKNNRHT